MPTMAAERSTCDGGYWLESFELYKSASTFYMLGCDNSKTSWRLLKIDASDSLELNINDDGIAYSESECIEMLTSLERSTSGLQFVTVCYGIIGFIKFLGPYYMLVITDRMEIGTIFGHKVYQVTKTEMIEISFGVQSDLINAKDESRYKRLLYTLDLRKDFFFSYSYHIMRSLQKNLSNAQEGQALYETMFVWNEYLTREIRNLLGSTLWTVALVYGFFKQDKFSIAGKDFLLTLIARRSRHYAGTRYLKRGVNEKGRVANDVETEQIVCSDIHGENLALISSVVQNRGSIPLFWSQEASKLNLRPDIMLHRKDKNYDATRLHFQNLRNRYGNPIIILNLIKKLEKKPRESILRREFLKAINIINRDLSKENHLRFLHWDLHTNLQSKGSNVLTSLMKVALEALNLTGFFYCQVAPTLITDLLRPELKISDVQLVEENSSGDNNTDVLGDMLQEDMLASSDASGSGIVYDKMETFCSSIVEEKRELSCDQSTNDKTQLSGNIVESKLESSGNDILEDEMNLSGEEVVEEKAEAYSDGIVEDQPEALSDGILEDKVEHHGDDSVEDKSKMLDRGFVEDKVETTSDGIVEDKLEKYSDGVADEPEASGDGIVEDNEDTSGHGFVNHQIRRSGHCPLKTLKFQNGVLRTNCIDCLDRTNVAQYAYGLAALGQQLHALGLTDAPAVDLDDPLAHTLMYFYEKMGDTLAIQYGGSAAHNKVFSHRRGYINFAIQSQEFFRTLQRHYNNAYMDAYKQAAINLFLGYFQPQKGKPAIWELDSDLSLHSGEHTDFSKEDISRKQIKRAQSDANIHSESNISLSGHLSDQNGILNSVLTIAKNRPEPQNVLTHSVQQMPAEEGSVSHSRYNRIESDLQYPEVEGIEYSDDSGDSNFFDVCSISSAGNLSEDEQSGNENLSKSFVDWVKYGETFWYS